jgi:hypothetical protein
VRDNKELILAVLAVVMITGLYAAATALGGVPAASGFLGHGLGILGFTLMLLTETLYSLRKRAVRRPWGTMRSWLQFHIFTGIVGPYLVFLHAAWEFQGLAGALTLMTGVVVLSGFVGRYIYTAVPRTAEGVMIEAQALQGQLTEVRAQAEGLAAARGRSAETERASRLAHDRLRQLERQVGALRWARRMLAVWHTVHIPLGMVLFVTAFVHAGAALYYATLLR